MKFSTQHLPLRSSSANSRYSLKLHSDEIPELIKILRDARDHVEASEHHDIWLMIEYADRNGASTPTDHYYICNNCRHQ